MQGYRILRWLLRPHGLISGITLILLAALVLQFAGNTFFYEQAELNRIGSMHAERLGEQLTVAARVLAATKAEDRAEIAQALSTDSLSLTWRAVPSMTGPTALSPALETLQREVLRHRPALQDQGLALDGPTDPHRRDPSNQASGEVRLNDGSALAFFATNLGHNTAGLVGSLFSTALLAAGLICATALLTRRLGSPLRSLAEAANAVGHGMPVTVSVPARGPREVRQLAQALNAMQERIARLISDRTEALAAVSHDLRTPIARLRLRLDLSQDHLLRQASEADLDDMEKMVGSVLAYLRGDADPEAPRPVNIAALLTTLIEATLDAGQDVTYTGPSRAVLTTRPLAIKRAITNLLENALRYGERAYVSLRSEAGGLSILVEDDGPGIPDSELDRVFQPFHRLEESRSRTTGGVGLGLAIARQAIEANGGTIALRNRATKGLCAEVILPRQRAMSPAAAGSGHIL